MASGNSRDGAIRRVAERSTEPFRQLAGTLIEDCGLRIADMKPQAYDCRFASPFYSGHVSIRNPKSAIRDPMVGEKINQYKILEKIGSGGQGTVYKALDTKLNRTVVI